MNKKIYTSIIFLLFAFLASFQGVSASAQDKLKGYAWSDNIGWISFNCFNTDTCDDVEYGVTADSSGNLSGYAWSDHVGWLSFSYYSNATINTSTGVISGDAHFLAADAVNEISDPSDGDSWEGRVSLSGTSPSYGPTLNSSTFELEGYAWGSNVVGWISFNNPFSEVTYDPFYFSLTSNKGTESNKVPYTGSVILTWVTDGASSCTASNGNTQWTDVNPKSAGEPSPSVQTITTMVADTTFTLTCQDSTGNTIERSLAILVEPPAPVVNIWVSEEDSNIGYGTQATLRWNALNVQNCEISGDGSFSPAQSVSTGANQSILTGGLTNSLNLFSLECESIDNPPYIGEGGLGNGIYGSNVYVDVEKLEVQFYPEQSALPYNDKIRLYYQVEFPTTCTTSGTVPGWATHTVDLSQGEHTFETPDPITTEGIQYTATLQCNGANSQQETVNILIKSGKNPIYQEV